MTEILIYLLLRKLFGLKIEMMERPIKKVEKHWAKRKAIVLALLILLMEDERQKKKKKP